MKNRILTGRKAILKVNGQTVGFFGATEEFSDRWANKYAIRTERLVERLGIGVHHKAYGAVFKLYVLLNKLNVKCHC